MQRAVVEALVMRGQVQGDHDVTHVDLDMKLVRLQRQPSLMDCITPF